jgi:hypothetical protein
VGELFCGTGIYILGIVIGIDDPLDILAFQSQGIELLIEVVLGGRRDGSTLSDGSCAVDGLRDRC